MKFSALNVVLSPGLDLGLRTGDVREGCPSKKWLLSAIGLSNVKMVADRHIHAAHHDKVATSFLGKSTSMTLNSKNRCFSAFCVFLAAED